MPTHQPTHQLNVTREKTANKVGTVKDQETNQCIKQFVCE